MENKLESQGRRRLILGSVQGIGAALMGSFVWSAFVSENAKASFILRPPGAKPESDFLKSCIRCGLCVEYCPFHTLKLAQAGSGLPLGTPYFTPREIPCYMCEDIPCVPVCPTGALDRDLVSTTPKEQKSHLDIKKARMGVAVVDQKHCIAYWGIQCDACYRACPLLDEAISLEYKRNDRTGKHSYLLPIVDGDVCTGCGLCERACVTEKAAITILPRESVLGRVGSNYIKGWDAADEKRLDAVEVDPKRAKRDSKGAANYLNSGEL